MLRSHVFRLHPRMAIVTCTLREGHPHPYMTQTLLILSRLVTMVSGFVVTPASIESDFECSNDRCKCHTIHAPSISFIISELYTQNNEEYSLNQKDQHMKSSL